MEISQRRFIKCIWELLKAYQLIPNVVIQLQQYWWKYWWGNIHWRKERDMDKMIQAVSLLHTLCFHCGSSWSNEIKFLKTSQNDLLLKVPVRRVIQVCSVVQPNKNKSTKANSPYYSSHQFKSSSPGRHALLRHVCVQKLPPPPRVTHIGGGTLSQRLPWASPEANWTA